MIRAAILRFSTVLLALTISSSVVAERQPVLKQIDVPHDYYFREMYLPQLTTGPSSLSWSPDGGSLVYSMQGSLWRQKPGSGVAEQLTAGPGYDYQPDVSPDGQHVVFVRYLADAMELYTLDLETRSVTALTSGGAVNVEPRWSPDGARLAFVSTRDSGRFHVFAGDFVAGQFTAAPVVEERESTVPRYYYSNFDHELSPAWTPDGNSIVYVGNADVPYGTGNIWQIEMHDGAVPKLVRKEETTWKARPDVSPDGKRIAYASYLGRQSHQLWVTRIDTAAEPFPLSYGEFDITAPRWSPDGSKIAFINNESGNTAIRIQDVVGGRTEDMTVARRSYLVPMLDFDLRVVDAEGAPVAARVSVVASDGRSYAPSGSLIHADDSFDRERSGFETRYFHTDGYARLKLPVGATRITVWHGPENEIVQRLVNLAAEHENWLTVTVNPLAMPEAWANWVSGDVHVHMNYGGTYHTTPQRLVAQANAEDLDIVFNLIVNKEQRVPDIGYFSSKPDNASDDDVLLLHSQEFHTSFWGHLGLLGLNSHLLIPDYSAYPGTAAASLFPDNAAIAKLARAQNAAVGYVHPFGSPPPNPETDEKLTSALPVDVALGLIDYYEVVGFADHRASAQVWYGLLNCGFRVAAAGGTDAMTNYASLRGPVGINRVYVRVPGDANETVARRDEWLSGLKSSHTMATNGPLLGFSVNEHGPGAELALGNGKHELQIEGFLRSAVDVDHLEIVHNGKVVKTIDLKADRRSADFSTRIDVDSSGWLLLRAWNDTSNPLLFDLYPYATTSPIFVTVGGKPMHSKEDADYFIAWIERVRESAESHPDYNSDAERDLVLSNLRQAQDVYESCR